LVKNEAEELVLLTGLENRLGVELLSHHMKSGRIAIG